MSASVLPGQATAPPSRARMQDLLFTSSRVATHLHWSDNPDRLREDPAWTRALWREGRMVGLLACTPPLSGVSWLRLCALADGVNARASLATLWRLLREDLLGQGVHLVCVIGGGPQWLQDGLQALGFAHREEIVSLCCLLDDGAPDIPVNPHVRLAREGDCENLLALDAAAFPPHWHMPAQDMRRALRRAACFTVVAEEDAILAYQFTSRGESDAHVARLGVAPARQGQGLGTALLADLMRRLQGRGLVTLSLNTQELNSRSLRLYQRFGFRRNGMDYSVWSQRIAPGAAQR